MDDQPATVVAFPLRGEWTAVNTPAERVPSHGTDQLGQRFAFDFLRIDWASEGFRFHAQSTLRYAVVGVPLDACFGWAASIHAPFEGVVTASSDGWPERSRVHMLRDLAVVLRNASRFDPNAADLRPLLGNHLILRDAASNVHALVAHARCGSVRAAAGDRVMRGQHVADVGHSGNSTAPHLHFQLMDGPDLRTAQGLPCAFAEYDVHDGNAWQRVNDQVPGKRQRLRFEG